MPTPCVAQLGACRHVQKTLHPSRDTIGKKGAFRSDGGVGGGWGGEEPTVTPDASHHHAGAGERGARQINGIEKNK